MEHKKTGTNNDRRLTVLGLALLPGAAAGSLLCARWESLQNGLLARGQAPAAFWQALWPDLLLLCGLFLCGFSRSGSGIALAIMAVKGFCLSAFSAGILLKNDFLQVICQLLLPGLLSLTALLLTGRQAIGLALTRQRTRKPILPDSAWWLTGLICLALLLLAAALQVWLEPRLWELIQNLLT